MYNYTCSCSPYLLKIEMFLNTQNKTYSLLSHNIHVRLFCPRTHHVHTTTVHSYSMEGDIHTDGERNIGEGFMADILDREFVTMSKLPVEVRKQLRVKFDNR